MVFSTQAAPAFNSPGWTPKSATGSSRRAPASQSRLTHYGSTRSKQWREFARLLNKPADNYERLSAQAKNSFQKFWNAERNCCFDVIDVPGLAKVGGKDACASSKSNPRRLSARQSAAQRPAKIRCRHLRAAPAHFVRPAQPRVRRGPATRATTAEINALATPPIIKAQFGAGCSARSRWRISAFTAIARRLSVISSHSGAASAPTASALWPKSFDGDPPHSPRGCIAQAWTVGELLRAWSEIAKGA